MFNTLPILLALAASVSPDPKVTSGPPCPIQRAAASGDTVLLLCSRDQVMVSNDRGQSWRISVLPAESRLRSAVLLDARRGFIVGDGGMLLATADAAETWTRIALPTAENLTSIYFAGDHGWLAGWTGIVFHTSDAGRTWTRQSTGVFQGLESIYFLDKNHGWAAGWAGTILRTADGGATWHRVQTDTLWSLSAVYFLDRQRGWAAGFGGQVLHTKDGGVTWREQPSPVRGWMRSIAFDHLGRGWIAADNHLLLSEDGGESWKALPVEGTPFLHQILVFPDGVWTVGQFGVLKSTGPGQSFTALANFPAGGQETARVQLNSRRNHHDTQTPL